MSRYRDTGGAYPPDSDFAGLEYRRPRPDQSSRAVRGMVRHRQDRRLTAKLDELLGSVEDDYPEEG